jgi:hypothetical protein
MKPVARRRLRPCPQGRVDQAGTRSASGTPVTRLADGFAHAHPFTGPMRLSYGSNRHQGILQSGCV